MDETEPYVDIHCHLLPDIDEGSNSWDESLAMARMAVAEGTSTVICTPHQLGSYAHNDAQAVRDRTGEMQKLLQQQRVSLRVLPGAEVRLDAELVAQVSSGQVLTLADQGKHVLIELPHETYEPFAGVIRSLKRMGLTGILAHPERNQGLLRQPQEIQALVSQGCLMQVTADSVLGMFGPRCQRFVEQMLIDGTVHFVATDARGAQSRRPLLRRAFELVSELAGINTAVEIFCRNPACVAAGDKVPVRPPKPARRVFPRSWFRRRRAG
jgi:protein-tyrosine phosphatase